MSDWISNEDRLPAENMVVETKIDDAKGIRNVGTILKRQGRLWYFADDSMYVYYWPTHWRLLEPDVKAKLVATLLKRHDEERKRLEKI